MDILPQILKPLTDLLSVLYNFFSPFLITFIEFINVNAWLDNTDITFIFVAATTIFILFIYLLIKLVTEIKLGFSKSVLATSTHEFQNREYLKDETYQQALKVLEDARHKSLQILSESHTQAHSILNEFEGFTTDVKQELEQSLKTLSEKQIGSLAMLSEDMLTAFRSTVEKEAFSGIKDFKESFKNETLESQHKVDQQIEESYVQIKSELETYRQGMLKKIDENVFEILTHVTNGLFGKALSLEDHEQLIKHILEEAKAKSKFTL